MKKDNLIKAVLIILLFFAATIVPVNAAKAAGKETTKEDARTYILESRESGLLKNNETEYYKFSLEKNACVQFDIKTGSHYQKASMRLLDGSGHNLDYYGTKDPNNWGYQIFSKKIALAAGDYYLSVSNWYGDGDVSYSIDSKIVAEDTDTVRLAGLGNEFLSTAHPFVPGNQLQSVTYYRSGKECHRYKLELKSDQTVVFRAKADLAKKQKILFVMYDGNGKKLSLKSTKLKGYIWNVKAALKKGTYYIGIQANSDDIPYTVYTAAVPKKLSGVKAASPGKKQMKITWKKSSIDCTGYEIQYCMSKNFKSSKVYKAEIKKQKTISWKKKGLKSKRKYYVRVRAYQELDGRKIYGTWSAVRPAKIK